MQSTNSDIKNQKPQLPKVKKKRHNQNKGIRSDGGTKNDNGNARLVAP